MAESSYDKLMDSLGIGAAAGFGSKGVKRLSSELTSRTLPTEGSWMDGLQTHKILEQLPDDVRVIREGKVPKYVSGLWDRALFLPPDVHPGVAAHEAGHALSDLKLPLRKVRHAGHRLGSHGLPIATLLAALSGDPKWGRAAAIAGAASMAPTIVGELAASGIGSKLMHDTGSKLMRDTGSKLMRGTGLRGRLAPFIGVPSYLVAAATPWMAYKFRGLLGGHDKKADSYCAGFMQKCAQAGVDPEKLLKHYGQTVKKDPKLQKKRFEEMLEAGGINVFDARAKSLADLDQKKLDRIRSWAKKNPKALIRASRLTKRKKNPFGRLSLVKRKAFEKARGGAFNKAMLKFVRENPQLFKVKQRQTSTTEK
jgi:hypothetical protein